MAHNSARSTVIGTQGPVSTGTPWPRRNCTPSKADAEAGADRAAPDPPRPDVVRATLTVSQARTRHPHRLSSLRRARNAGTASPSHRGCRGLRACVDNLCRADSMCGRQHRRGLLGPLWGTPCSHHAGARQGLPINGCGGAQVLLRLWRHQHHQETSRRTSPRTDRRQLNR